MLADTLVGRSNAWGYIIERSGPDAGALVGATTERLFYDAASATRLRGAAATRNAVRESVLYLEERDWPVGFYQHFDPDASLTPKYHRCYLHRGYDPAVCALPVEQQYVPWSSADVWQKSAAGPASCGSDGAGSLSCIRTGVVFGNVEQCGGPPPLIVVKVNSSSWSRPNWINASTPIVEGLIGSAEECQAWCQGYSGCEHFTYEWEQFVAFEMVNTATASDEGTG